MDLKQELYESDQPGTDPSTSGRRDTKVLGHTLFGTGAGLWTGAQVSDIVHDEGVTKLDRHVQLLESDARLKDRLATDALLDAERLLNPDGELEWRYQSLVRDANDADWKYRRHADMLADKRLLSDGPAAFPRRLKGGLAGAALLGSVTGIAAKHREDRRRDQET